MNLFNLSALVPLGLASSVGMQESENWLGHAEYSGLCFSWIAVYPLMLMRNVTVVKKFVQCRNNKLHSVNSYDISNCIITLVLGMCEVPFALTVLSVRV